MAERRVICPECGKDLKWRGLNGHLRFEHDMNSDQARRVGKTVEPFEVEDEPDSDERLLSILERVEGVLNGRGLPAPGDQDEGGQEDDDQDEGGQEDEQHELSAEALTLRVLERLANLQRRIGLVEDAEREGIVAAEMASQIKQQLAERVSELEEGLAELQRGTVADEEQLSWWDKPFW